MSTTLKRCSRCAQWLPRGAFSMKRDEKDGKAFHCRGCQSKYSRQRREKITEADREKERTARRALRRSNQNIREGERFADIRNAFGITRNQVLSMYGTQNGMCAACAIPIELFNKATHVDHCHKTGRVRGLLCMSCNSALGAAKDDQTRLIALVEYLRRTEWAPDFIGPMLAKWDRPKNARGGAITADAKERLSRAQSERWARNRRRTQLQMGI